MDDKKTSKRISLALPKDVEQIIENHKQDEDWKNQSKFIFDAIRHYDAYLACEPRTTIFNKDIEKLVAAQMDKMQKGISTSIFKLAVDTAMLFSVLADGYELRPKDLQGLRAKIIKQVKDKNNYTDLEGIVKNGLYYYD